MANWFFTRVPRPSNGEKAVFQKTLLAKLDIQIQKNEAALLPRTVYKMCLKSYSYKSWDLNLRNKNIKIFEENKSRYSWF